MKIPVETFPVEESYEKMDLIYVPFLKEEHARQLRF